MIFLFSTLVAILFRRAKHFSNLGRGSSKERFCGIILKIGDLALQEMSLKVFLLKLLWRFW